MAETPFVTWFRIRPSRNLPTVEELKCMNPTVDWIVACVTDTTEDILAKYRKPAAGSSLKPANGTAVQEVGASKERERLDADDNAAVYDSNNLEHCKAFLDAKKKLRLILSHVDLQVGCRCSHCVSSS